MKDLVEMKQGCPNLGHGIDVVHNAASKQRQALPEPELLDVRGVAAMLSCSERTVWRLSDGGKMPAAVRVGRLVRWPRSALREWIDSGCPPTRVPGRRRSRRIGEL